MEEIRHLSKGTSNGYYWNRSILKTRPEINGTGKHNTVKEGEISEAEKTTTSPCDLHYMYEAGCEVLYHAKTRG